MNLLAKVKDLIAKKEKIQPDLIRLDSELLIELGIDSISFVELIMEIEMEFKVKFEKTEFHNFATVKDIVDCLERKQRSKEGSVY
ncbi:hypothetical protein FACS1894198_3960 [Clostridia bacterium]|nr:hypothetical protein FACS1894198_3960 [Clostridia bacterium]